MAAAPSQVHPVASQGLPDCVCGGSDGALRDIFPRVRSELFWSTQARYSCRSRDFGEGWGL
eukprot:1933905-Pleurochrysis_carterae.AAC.1